MMRRVQCILLCVHSQNDIFPSSLLLRQQAPLSLSIPFVSLVDFQNACKMTSRPSGIAGNQEPKSPNLYYYSHVLDLNTGLVRYSYSNCNININCFQAVSDLRQARRRHAVEMQHMARRPFATQSVVLEYSNAYMLEPYRQLAKCSTGKADQNSGSKKSHQVPLVFY